MTALTTTVLVPTLERPERLQACVRALGRQTAPPTEVIVVWQGDDTPSRDAAAALVPGLPVPLRVLHSAERGIVPAENAGLAAAAGDVVLLIDDDALAPPEWLARHLRHYTRPDVGAVGGPVMNHRPDGVPFAERRHEPIGRLTWFGKPIGNLHDQPAAWSGRAPIDVDHLTGPNLSIRRRLLTGFERHLKAYWQSFELDACLAVGATGHRVVFDFGNPVAHVPSNPAFITGREGDLALKVFNAAHNLALVLAKHSDARRAPWRLLYLLLVGSTATPGLLGAAWAVRRFGRPAREAGILGGTWRAHLEGWRTGRRCRVSCRAHAADPTALERCEAGAR
jgi:glycosyltransferase involved in cell wall biosynthesis